MEYLQNSFVVIVNKETSDSDKLKTFLDEQQIENTVLTTGNALFELLEKRIPDLIILDTILEDESGFKICKVLKSQNLYKDIPVIFIAKNTNIQDVVKGFDIGAADYVLAPFSNKEFLARVKTQIELNQTRTELKEVNLLKEKMFSIVVHDLRSPFTSIMGFANFIMTDVEILSKKEIKEMAHNIYKSSKSAILIMENFLEWAKVQINKIEFNPETINLSKSLNNILLLNNLIAKKKNIIITNKISEEIFAYVDLNLLETIIRNILSNAIKFSYPNSKIIVSAKKTGKEILISVKDFGIGIDKKNINKLFKPEEFFSNLGTQNEKGIGIGLYLCQELAKIQSGKIWVESQLNEGTEFFISIPVN